MTKLQIPSNEEERLNSLYNYDVLDSTPESDYDDLAKMAALICETPIALISFVDSERMFFKAKFGLNVFEVSRNESFCAHAINFPSELFVVNDTRTDKRFVGNAIITKNPHMIFYAGMPLVTDKGHALGVICVIDKKPRTLSEQQKQALKILAKQTVNLLQLRAKNKEQGETHKKLTEYASEMQSFAHTAAHDLKEPVRTIRSFLNLLDEECGNSLNSKAQKYLKTSVDSAERMDILINDLLEYSNALAEKKNQYREVNVEEMIEEIKAEIKPLINQKGARIKTSSMPVIWSSPIAIKQIFLNLVNNAMKYQLPGKAPELSIEASEDDLFWKFSVRDNGIGIPTEFQGVIFESFKRLHRKDEYPGNGLGLAICKRRVEKLGGEIWVKSEEGKGSTFYFNIEKIKSSEIVPN